MRSRIVRWATPGLGAMLLGLLAPSLASAQTTPASAWIYIDDNGATTQPDSGPIKSSLNTGSYSIPGTTSGAILGDFVGTSATNAIIQEQEITALVNGQVNMHFDYFDSHPLPAGTAAVANFLITASWEPGLSDTLSVRASGHQPGTADPTNTSVDLHFLSAALNNQLPILEPAVTVDGFITGDFTAGINAVTGLANLHVTAWSEQFGPDTPEPSTFLIAATAAVMGLGYWRRSRRHAAA
jgi:hypothetical protein